MTSFSEALQGAMDRAGLSASDLAQRSAHTESAISLLRSGRRTPSFRSIQALSKALPELATQLAAEPVEESVFDCIDDAVADIRAGKMVIVLDDEDRENEGDLVMAAQMVTPRSDQLHAQRGGWPHLRHDHRQAARRITDSANGYRKYSAARDGVHRFDRSAPSHDDGYFRAGRARPRFRRYSIRAPSLRISRDRATRSRYAPAKAACSYARAKRKPRST